MDQLVQMMNERNCDMNQLKLKQTKNNLVFLQKQKNRIQKQNLIIKILNSSKFINTELKIQIYFKTIQMMKTYISMENYVQVKKEDIDNGFMEKYINLYVYFYNNFEDGNDKTFKTIVRPNNNHIIVDLIKSLIEINRAIFKKLFFTQMNIKKQEKILKIKSPKAMIKQLPDLAQKINKNKEAIKIYNEEQHRRSERIDNLLTKKYRMFIRSINFQELQKRANEAFKTLKQNNQKNNSIIHRYRDNCFGHKKKIEFDYDFSGLYTKEQMLNMSKSVKKEEELLALSQDKEVNPEIIPQDEIKQNIRMQFELEQSQNFISLKKDRKIQKWLPLILSKTNLRSTPFQILIINNKLKLKFSEYKYQNSQQYMNEYFEFYFSQIKNKTLSSYKAQNNYKSQQSSQDFSALKFNKKDFLDYNRKKQLQLLEGDKHILRKDFLLPELNNKEMEFLQNLTPVKNHLQKKIRSFSEKRLPHVQSINSKKLQQVQSTSTRSLTKNIDMKFTSSSFMKKNDFKSQKDKFSLVIQEKTSISKMQTEQQNTYRNRIKSLLQNKSNNVLLRPYQAYQGSNFKRRQNALYTNSFLYQ